MGGTRVWTDQNLKALREVLECVEPWTTMSVVHAGAKNCLRFPDENFKLDLADLDFLFW